ncbi:HAMP domain-containing sensor histidine kinase [Polluticaenibacter yanchengensis]|uniref:histidine kinase n=1 Tax=Polluticaenibacter yanchengensis TaxID=3014562 RepID=A0ABT4UHK1_9BACT|nr:HAMP domain-containing sensor histidine kinase [Chitinophagaceae bacterium LY-5]
MKLLENTNIRHKTTVMFLLSTVAIVTFLSIVFYTSIEKIIDNDNDETLKLKSDIVAQLYLDDLRSKTNPDSIENNILALKLNRELVFSVKENHLSVLADSLKLPLMFLEQINTLQNGFYENDSLQYVGKKYNAPEDDFIVITSSENYFKKHIQKHLQRIMVISFFVVVFITFLISLYLSKNLFKPIVKITTRVKEISSQSLHLRLEKEKYNKELNQLINTFNEMLNRIETSFESQNNFISNASHELRTPLTSIIGVADVCLSKERQSEDYIETLTVILNEAEKLDRKTKALLSLAQTGFSGKVLKQEPIRIDELLWDCIATIQSLNQQSKIHFDISLIPENSAKLVVNGNKQLLHLAFSNIILNGCKYSNNELVKVSIGATNSKVVIIVQDHGIGIPKDEQQYIYDPFYRCSNTKKYEGYGIGLPLTRNIIKMHKGSILINSAENMGTIVEIHLPFK